MRTTHTGTPRCTATPEQTPAIHGVAMSGEWEVARRSGGRGGADEGGTHWPARSGSCRAGPGGPAGAVGPAAPRAPGSGDHRESGVGPCARPGVDPLPPWGGAGGHWDAGELTPPSSHPGRGGPTPEGTDQGRIRGIPNGAGTSSAGTVVT